MGHLFTTLFNISVYQILWILKIIHHIRHPKDTLTYLEYFITCIKHQNIMFAFYIDHSLSFSLWIK